MAGSFNGGSKGGKAVSEEADDVGGETPKKSKKGAKAKGAKGSKKRAAEEDAEGDDDEIKKVKVEDEVEDDD